MIVAEAPEQEYSEFINLLRELDDNLNAQAKTEAISFRSKAGKALENVVLDALKECAENTPFRGTIMLVSGQKFPDIVAKRIYGVEVKSTTKDGWTSVGSSILESTRVEDVKRIFMTFGNLGHTPPLFSTKPYEECLSDIVVTHYPRYIIDMNLQENETIFSKMKVPYENLRMMDNPVPTVAKYYKGNLKEGESLWWTGDNLENEVSPVKVKLWNTLDSNERKNLIAQSMAFFTESICGSSSNKYERVVLWLATKNGVLIPNVRDAFSSGGQVDQTVNLQIIPMPKVFEQIKKHKELILDAIENASEEDLINLWDTPKIEEDRVTQWCKKVVSPCQDKEKRDLFLLFLKECFELS